MAKRAAVVGMLVVVVCIATGAAQARAATPEQVTQANRAAAVVAADRLIADVRLPLPARRVGGAPAGSGLGSQTYSRLFFHAQVDHDAFWMTEGASSAVIDSIKGHLPPGAKLTDSGVNDGTESYATFALPTIDPARLGVRQLVVEAIPLANGAAGVRVDAEVQYIAPRPYDERVPSQARLLEITIKGSSPHPLLSLTLTRPALVRDVANVVDALPFVGSFPGAAVSCPLILGQPDDTFVFRARPGGPVLAETMLAADTPSTASPCLTASLTIDGRHERDLAEGGVLLRKAGALVGAKLTRR